MNATITTCVDCHALHVSIAENVNRARLVPGTGTLDCGHLTREESGTVSTHVAIHLALSTLLRSGDLAEEARNLAHQIQAWMAVPQSMWTVRKLPYLMTDGYGVSSAGLAVARIMAANLAKTATPESAFYWRAAASIMRRRLV